MWIPEDKKTRADFEKETYGRYNTAFDSAYCAKSIYGDMGRGRHQCTRKAVQGPENLWCKQHDPAEVKKRDDARDEKWAAEQRYRRGLYNLNQAKVDAAKLLVEVYRWLSLEERGGQMPAKLIECISKNSYVKSSMWLDTA